MANNILTKLFGNYSKRELKRIQPQVDRVLALEETYRGMDDETLKAETPRFRKLLEEGMKRSLLTISCWYSSPM